MHKKNPTFLLSKFIFIDVNASANYFPGRASCCLIYLKLLTICQHFFFLSQNVLGFCWANLLLTLTPADPMRMDHTGLLGINTSMGNVWFPSAPRGWICLCLFTHLLHCIPPYCSVDIV